MLKSFNSGQELVAAYETTLYKPEVDLVIVKQALSAAAVNALRASVDMESLDDRTERFQEVLRNSLPLDDAEKVIANWGTSLPTGLRLFPTLEAAPQERYGAIGVHFDDSTALSTLIQGPFAISIGIEGQGQFSGLRLPERLTDEQLLATKGIRNMTAFEEANVEWGEFKSGANPATTVQGIGDLVLIPGTPQPSLHSVKVEPNQTRAAIVSSYMLTATALTPPEIRQDHEERLQLQREEALASIGHFLAG
jgi:hypothetical protein